MTGHVRRSVLHDAVADGALSARGFVTCALLSGQELQLLRAEVESLHLTGSSGFYDTAGAGLAFSERQAVHRLLCRVLGTALDRSLMGYQPVMSAIIHKWPGQDSQKDLHRDMRVVDERRHRAVCVWIPLVDVDDTNGALRVLPGSHMVDTSIRSVPRTPAVPRDAMHDLTFLDLDAVPAAAGEAVVFDLALIHGSDLNRSDAPRPAVGVALVPDDAHLSLMHCQGDDRVELLRVTDAEVFRRITWTERPTELRSEGVVCNRPEPMSADELLRRSRVVADARPSSGRSPSVEPHPAR